MIFPVIKRWIHSATHFHEQAPIVPISSPGDNTILPHRLEAHVWVNVKHYKHFSTALWITHRALAILALGASLYFANAAIIVAPSLTRAFLIPTISGCTALSVFGALWWCRNKAPLFILNRTINAVRHIMKRQIERTIIGNVGRNFIVDNTPFQRFGSLFLAANAYVTATELGYRTLLSRFDRIVTILDQRIYSHPTFISLRQQLSEVITPLSQTLPPNVPRDFPDTPFSLEAAPHLLHTWIHWIANHPEFFSNNRAWTLAVIRLYLSLGPVLPEHSDAHLLLNALGGRGGPCSPEALREFFSNGGVRITADTMRFAIHHGWTWLIQESFETQAAVLTAEEFVDIRPHIQEEQYITVLDERVVREPEILRSFDSPTLVRFLSGPPRLREAICRHLFTRNEDYSEEAIRQVVSPEVLEPLFALDGFSADSFFLALRQWVSAAIPQDPQGARYQAWENRISAIENGRVTLNLFPIRSQVIENLREFLITHLPQEENYFTHAVDCEQFLLHLAKIQALIPEKIPGALANTIYQYLEERLFGDFPNLRMVVDPINDIERLIPDANTLSQLSPLLHQHLSGLSYSDWIEFHEQNRESIRQLHDYALDPHDYELPFINQEIAEFIVQWQISPLFASLFVSKAPVIDNPLAFLFDLRQNEWEWFNKQLTDMTSSHAVLDSWQAKTPILDCLAEALAECTSDVRAKSPVLNWTTPLKIEIVFPNKPSQDHLLSYYTLRHSEVLKTAWQNRNNYGRPKRLNSDLVHYIEGTLLPHEAADPIKLLFNCINLQAPYLVKQILLADPSPFSTARPLTWKEYQQLSQYWETKLYMDITTPWLENQPVLQEFSQKVKLGVVDVYRTIFPVALFDLDHPWDSIINHASGCADDSLEACLFRHLNDILQTVNDHSIRDISCYSKYLLQLKQLELFLQEHNLLTEENKPLLEQAFPDFKIEPKI